MASERRGAVRYPIQLRAQYRLIHRRLTVDEGTARSVDISSSGILITANRTFTRGATLELTLHWPLLRDSRYPLELRITGVVVRSDEKGTALRALKRTSYSFDFHLASPGNTSSSGGGKGAGG
ncbi:MAG TPA: PilZ domain-containing protein [Bryobacteraceae bacterium]|jgi:hypothetical protein|nr:PilZ domain-containing protein [Bryobacteraceae bacterium]